MIKCCIRSAASYSAETWTLRKSDQKYVGSFEMWCWEGMDKSICTHRVSNKKILHRVKDDRNLLHKIKQKKADWIGHTLRRYCFVKHVIERKIERRTELVRRGGRRRKQLLDDFKEMRVYCKLKEEVLDRCLLGARCGRSCGPVVRQTVELMNTLPVLI